MTLVFLINAGLVLIMARLIVLLLMQVLKGGRGNLDTLGCATTGDCNKASPECVTECKRICGDLLTPDKNINQGVAILTQKVDNPCGDTKTTTTCNTAKDISNKLEHTKMYRYALSAYNAGAADATKVSKDCTNSDKTAPLAGQSCRDFPFLIDGYVGSPEMKGCFIKTEKENLMVTQVECFQNRNDLQQTFKYVGELEKAYQAVK